MSDYSMIVAAIFGGGGFALGAIFGRIGMVDPLRPHRRSDDDNYPLPLALRLVDQQRAAPKQRWSRLRLAKWLWRWGRS